MKKSILLTAFIAATLFCNAQLPVFENFNNGVPPGWELESAHHGDYNVNIAAVCTANQGILSTPAIGSNGNNKTGFTTTTLHSIMVNSVVTVTFKGYIYKGNKFECADQLFASTPCTAFGQVTLLSAVDGSTIGMSSNTSLNLTTGVNTIVTTVTAATLTSATGFRVLLDIGNVNCDVNGSIRFVIDDVIISATAGGPLPVLFKSFTAVRSSQNVALNWETATEQNSKGFYVQRNTNGTWENITFVPTKAVNGSSNADLSYSYNDINYTKAVSQYRIMQVDLDGKSKLSEVRSVRGEQGGKYLVFPNPTFDGKAQVLFGDLSGSHDVSLIDMSGRVVKQWTSIRTGSMQMDNLKPGFYYVKIYNSNSGEQFMEKIVVK